MLEPFRARFDGKRSSNRLAVHTDIRTHEHKRMATCMHISCKFPTSVFITDTNITRETNEQIITWISRSWYTSSTSSRSSLPLFLLSPPMKREHVISRTFPGVEWKLQRANYHALSPRCESRASQRPHFLVLSSGEMKELRPYCSFQALRFQGWGWALSTVADLAAVLPSSPTMKGVPGRGPIIFQSSSALSLGSRPRVIPLRS